MVVKLKASKCGCGKVSVPPKVRCPLCGKPMAGTEVANKGRILSYTVVHVVPDGFDAPRAVALVELDSGARVLAEIEDDHPLDSKVEVLPEGDTFKAKV